MIPCNGCYFFGGNITEKVFIWWPLWWIDTSDKITINVRISNSTFSVDSIIFLIMSLMTYLCTRVSPGTKPHMTVLIIKREVRDVQRTRWLKYLLRHPTHRPVMQNHREDISELTLRVRPKWKRPLLELMHNITKKLMPTFFYLFYRPMTIFLNGRVFQRLFKDQPPANEKFPRNACIFKRKFFRKLTFFKIMWKRLVFINLWKGHVSGINQKRVQ